MTWRPGSVHPDWTIDKYWACERLKSPLLRSWGKDNNRNWRPQIVQKPRGCKCVHLSPNRNKTRTSPPRSSSGFPPTYFLAKTLCFPTLSILPTRAGPNPCFVLTEVPGLYLGTNTPYFHSGFFRDSTLNYKTTPSFHFLNVINNVTRSHKTDPNSN